MREESQRVCVCGHQKRGHELPRTEGGHGGGTSGRCVAFGCSCRKFEPTEQYEEQEYVGDVLPSWVAEGVKLKVKRTSTLKQYGLPVRASGSDRRDSSAWPGEVGVVERHDGIGWWNWQVRFDRGRTTTVSNSSLEELTRVKR